MEAISGMYLRNTCLKHNSSMEYKFTVKYAIIQTVISMKPLQMLMTVRSDTSLQMDFREVLSLVQI